MNITNSRLCVTVLMLCASSIYAAEEGNITSYDIMWANWLQHSWNRDDGYGSVSTIASATQDINPGLMHRMSYSGDIGRGFRPFISAIYNEDNSLLSGIIGSSVKFDSGWRIGLEIESGSFDVTTNTVEHNGQRTSYTDKSTYNAVRVKAGTETWGAYLAVRQHVIPNIAAAYDTNNGSTVDLYYDKDYKEVATIIGGYWKPIWDIFDGKLGVELSAGIGSAYGKVGSDALDEITRDYNGTNTNMNSGGPTFDLGVDVSYKRNITGLGHWVVGVRSLGFGQIAEFTPGGQNTSDHPNGTTKVSFEENRFDMYYGPYLGIEFAF